jgi:G3E family GTPase
MRDYRTLDKKSLGIDERPPLIILSGFLGVGKTSFLQHFIEYQTQRSRFVAVIQNEIGEVGLDGKLLDYKVTEIDEGCVCCSLVGNLKRAVHGILSCFQPDYIILETTGAANPLNLLDEIVELEAQVRYDCTVTVVDALNLDSTLSQFAVAADQIRAADVLVLNKCDLVSEACLQKAHKLLQDIKPNAIVFTTTQGDLNPALIFDVEDRLVEKKNASPVVTGLKFPIRTSHVHDGLWCKTLSISGPLNRKDFLSAVESLPPTVFRIKGILEFSDSPHPMLFQYVAGRFELSPFHEPAVADRFLTVIAQGEGQEDFFSFIPAPMARTVT